MFYDFVDLLCLLFRKALNVRRQKRGRAKVFQNERGQGTTEYILILVVVVSIALGMIYQFNDAFKVWMDSYFGDYLACLIETGELPAIAGAGGAANTCEQEFQPFSFEAGRPSNQASTGGRGGSEGDDARSNPQRPRARSGSRARGRGVGGRSGGGFSRRRGTRTRVGGAGGGSSGGGKKKYTGSSKSIQVSGAYGRGGTKIKLDKKNRFMAGAYGGDKKKEDKLKTGGEKKQARGGDAKKAKVKFIPPRKVEEAEPDEGITFGGFLRFLIIAGIVIALVFLIGGQVLQISKSAD